MQTVGLAKRTRREQSSTVSDGDDVVITGQNEKDNEQQRRKSPRTTAGKGTRKKYADDTVVQEQLAKTSTKGNRESIQSETTTREVSGRDMDNGEVLTALAVKMVQSQTTELHKQKDHKMQEQQKYVVHHLLLSIYMYFIYCGRSHPCYSFCADIFYGLFSIMCLQLTFHTISQQRARLLLSTPFRSIFLFIAFISRRCW